MKRQLLLLICFFFFLAINQNKAQQVINKDTTAINRLNPDHVQIGYGTQATNNITGAVTSNKGNDFNKGAIIYSPLQLIQGKVPGLAIMRVCGGDPLQQLQMQLRGTTTLYANTEPLYVIDGVLQASLNTIMPEDIESIEVLRSASAAAIYGIRGANGVILVTTKKGRIGNPAVTYSAYSYFETIKKHSFLSASDWRQLKQEWSHSAIPRLRDYSAGMMEYGASTDWFNEITQHKVSQVHNLSFSGGSNKTMYWASVNYWDLNGTIKNSGKSLLNSRIAFSQLALKNKMKLEAAFSFTPSKYSQYRIPFINDPRSIVTEAELYNPTLPVNSIYWMDRANPFTLLNRYSQERYRNDWLAHARARYEIIKGLTLTTLFAKQNLSDKFNHSSQEDRPSGKYEHFQQELQQENTRTIEATLNYQASLANHHFDLLGGFSNQQFQTKEEQTETSYLAGKLDMSSGYNLNLHNKIESFFGRVLYNYRDKYFFTTSLRRDVALHYNWDHTPQYYPSYTVGWRINKEDFLQNQSWLSELKLRAGYGITGRQLDIYKNAGFSTRILTNSSLHGEKLSETNIGADLGLLSNHFMIQIDYYNRLTHDVIVEETIASPTSASGGERLKFTYNNGKLRNQGWEFSANIQPIITKRFKWYSSFNVSFNQNKLLFNVYPFPQSLMEGQPVGVMYSYPFAGFNSDGKVLYFTKTGRKAAIPEELNESDRGIVGYGLPKTYLGFTNCFLYSKFDLMVGLRGIFGFNIYNKNREENIFSPSRMNMLKEVMELDQNAIWNRYWLSYTDYFIEKGDFMKVDNITVGYRLSLKKLLIQQARVYASGNNLITVTQFKGFDPEMAGINGPRPGVYNSDNYPVTRTYSFGVNLLF